MSMKKAITYTDARGQSHLTPEGATVSDIAGLFISEKTPSGAAGEIAKVVLSRRQDIERIFKEHDIATDPDA
jgi:hypothetical protein